MRDLVTGVAGFLGSHLAEALIGRGDEVVGVDGFLDYYPRTAKEQNLTRLRDSDRFTFIEGSLQQLELQPLLETVDRVFHLAAQAGVRASWGQEFSVYTRNNVEATQRVLEAALGRNLKSFVYASSSSVYGDGASLPMREEAVLQPVSPYGVTKLAAEMLCHLYHVSHGLPTVSLRYFTVYGPRQRPDMAFHRLLRSALTGDPVPLYGDGRQTRDFTYVADAVSATIAAGERGSPGKVYNIGGGSRISLLDVIERVQRVTGKKLNLRREPAQKGDMRDTYADTTQALRDLAYEPQTDLPTGLQAQWDWIRRQAPV